MNISTSRVPINPVAPATATVGVRSSPAESLPEPLDAAEMIDAPAARADTVASDKDGRDDLKDGNNGE